MITICRHSASLVMPIGDPLGDFFLLVREQTQKSLQEQAFCEEKGFDTFIRGIFGILNPKTNVGKLRRDVLMI